MTDFDPPLRTDPSHARTELCSCGAARDRWDGGHSLSFMQRRLAGVTSSRWRDAIVDEVASGGYIRLTAVDDGEELTVWHHADVSDLVRVGEPVAVHSVYHVLAVGSSWLSVAETAA
jgi:hypothetical protein